MERKVCNPRELTDLWDGHEIGDPYLMRFDGRFYLYCSSHGGPGIKCWMSEDMIDFTYYGLVCEDDRVRGAYAPEVIYTAGRFYMVTSPVGSGHYLLRADSPTGPFEIISENMGLAIDGTQFVDDDGKGYFLRASGQGIVVHDMTTPDLIDVRGRVLKESFLGHWTEGPMVIKRDGRYFLTETGNHVLSHGYRVEYRVSDTAPDNGYRALREPILLLETRDEFHALGHSSTCVGPDMDTMYIVYHKNILDEWNRPKFRSLNLDRLFFNGDRMYTNATWWAQPAPVQPLCAGRGGENMIARDGMLYLPKETGDTFTAEINLTLKDDHATVAFSRDGRLTIGCDSAWTLSLPEGQYEGQFCAAVDAKARMTIKVSMKKGALKLYVNNLQFFEGETALTGGEIGLSANCEMGFVGFSNVAQGSAEGEAPKAIPGVWDALHAQEEVTDQVPTERGCVGAYLKTGDALRYPVSVCRGGRYHLCVAMKARVGDAKLRITCGAFDAVMRAPCVGVADREGMEKRYLGVVTLEAGEQTLTIACEGESVALDRIDLYESDEFASADIVKNGDDVTGGALHIIGHKAKKSMLRKFSGLTCAEGYGEGYFGGAWRDYEVRSDVFMQPVSPDASASVYLRSRLESWHPHQISAARFAYRVSVTPGKIELTKQEYKEIPLVSASLDLEFPAVLSLICRVQGSRVAVYRVTPLGEQLLLEAADLFALPCGKVGIDARGDGIGFLNVSVGEIKQ